MNELARHIEILLLDNDCVILPGFGGFVAHYTPAMWVKDECRFLPPSRKIGFNAQLKMNDGVLVQSYMSAYDTNFSDANRRVEKAVNELVGLLHEEGKIPLENIGELCYTMHETLEFVPYDYRFTTPSLYGLDSFEIKELKTLQKPVETTLAPVTPQKEANTYELRINRSFLRYAAAVIVAAVLFFASSTPVQNTAVSQTSYARLIPTELLEYMGSEGHSHDTVMSRTSVHQKIRKPSTVQPRNLTSKDAVISRPIAVKPVKLSATPVVDVKPASDDHYYLIVAAGISYKAALSHAEELQKSGYTKAQALNEGGKVRVCISSYESYKEASSQLASLRENEAYQTAWILRK
ncbi:MAG: SPOR domain-containing protein [Bacteroidia bacterium]|nr:SPOR domain-containing protein [Bacteroidia bacterium]